MRRQDEPGSGDSIRHKGAARGILLGCHISGYSRAALDSARSGGDISGADNSGVLLRHKRRRAPGHGGANTRTGLQGVPASGGYHIRGHGHIEGGNAGDGHPDGLLRPAVADAGEQARAAAGADGGGFHAGDSAHDSGDNHRVRSGGDVRVRAFGSASVYIPVRAVGASVHRISVRHRAEDGESGGGELQLPAVLPVRVPDDGVRAERGHDRMAGHGRHV